MPREIAPEETAEWLQHGYVVVRDFLDASELKAVWEDVSKHYPAWPEFAARRGEFKEVEARRDHWTDFPFKGDALTDVSVSPQVVRFVEQQLGERPFLVHSVLWPKYAGTHDFEQPLHVDFHNNTLAYPRDDGRFRLIPFILYLTDVTIDLAPTWVVTQEVTGTDPETILTTILTPDGHPEAYERQEPVLVPAGSLLVYSLRTFHRASSFTAETGHRFTLNFGYRAASCPWSGLSPNWPVRAGTAEMHRFLARATPAQRALIGFPLPDDDYWNDETLTGVGRRFPKMDMTPYREAASHAHK